LGLDIDRWEGDKSFVSIPTQLPFPDEEEENEDKGEGTDDNLPNQPGHTCGFGGRRTWVQIGAGTAHTVLRTAEGHVYVWGESLVTFHTKPLFPVVNVSMRNHC
jgi:alpha-tubulin suppressor-like RCC1 family protein